MNRSKSIKDQEQDMRWNQLSQYDMLASLNIVQNHFCFNDYMERIISTVIISTFIFILSSWLSSVIPCQGSMARIWSRWDSTTRVRRIYLDSVKFCADLVWHSGTVRSSTQTLRTGKPFMSQSTKRSRRKPTPDPTPPWWATSSP